MRKLLRNLGDELVCRSLRRTQTGSAARRVAAIERETSIASRTVALFATDGQRRVRARDADDHRRERNTAAAQTGYDRLAPGERSTRFGSSAGVDQTAARRSLARSWIR
jgi:hypothetical protein